MRESTKLFCTTGGSDKVYIANLVPRGDGFVVTYQNGRRGGTLQSGEKTATPLPYADAKKVYDKLVASKIKGGYTPTEGGEAYQDTALAGRASGIEVQLLNPVADGQRDALIADPNWAAQEKWDGTRLALVIDGGTVVGVNRKGLTIPLQGSLVDLVLAHIPITGRTILDGEHLGGDVVGVFDVIERDGQCLRGRRYRERLAIATELVANVPEWPSPITAITAADKRALYERLRAGRHEGVVFRRLNSVYAPGRPASGGDALKDKFVESATVRVIEPKAGKRSVTIEAMDPETCLWHGIGSVTIPPNYAMPAAGAIVEVEYLYAFPLPGGSLFQPVYRGERTDQDAGDCLTTQLKFKAEAAHAQAA
jgi:bifunctional non-homologous end joining protein LigD